MLTFLAAFLVTTGMIGLWELIVLVLLTGGVFAMDMPISRTLVFDYAGRERLLSATSLNSMIMDLGAIAGPWVAGTLIASAGVAAALYLLSAAYAVAFVVLSFNKVSRRGSGDPARKRVL